MNQTVPEKESFVSEVLRFTLIALLIVFPIRLFIAQPFIVSGSSMDPTFKNGEYLIVDQVSYHTKEPERGDVIIFKFPEDTSKFFIKRIVGLPEETVTISDGEVTVFSKEMPNGRELEEPYVTHRKIDSSTLMLGDGQYFVLGDNRAASSDSRVWGALERDLIVGRAFLRLLPVSDVSIFPGVFNFDNGVN